MLSVNDAYNGSKNDNSHLSTDSYYVRLSNKHPLFAELDSSPQ